MGRLSDIIDKAAAAIETAADFVGDVIDAVTGDDEGSTEVNNAADVIEEHVTETAEVTGQYFADIQLSVNEQAAAEEAAAAEAEAMQDVNRRMEIALFGEYSPSFSIKSRSIFSYDIPEVKDLNADFVYNFFTPDERSSIKYGSDKLVNLDTSRTSELFYQLKNDNIPRYIKFSFKPAVDPYATLAKKITTEVSENVNKILMEGAGSSPFFTGIEILDTNAENSIYSMLSGSITFLSLGSGDDSVKSSSEKLESLLGENGGLTGASKKIILEAMSNLQSEGLVFAESDIDSELAAASSDPISRQTFSVKFNNLFFNDMILRGARLPDKVFQDEIRSLASPSNTIQQTILKSIDPTTISEAEYQNQIEAIETRPVDEKVDAHLYDGPSIVQVGYIIQRIEVLSDGSSVALPNIYINNPQGLYAIDSEVRYGGFYVYKVRTVCRIETLMREIDVDSQVLTEDLVYAKFLIASEGVTAPVHCVETLPPPPPSGFRVRMDYKQKLPTLAWQFPINPQRDIKRFQMFKRMSVDEPFQLIGEYDFDDSEIKTSVNEVALSQNLYKLDYPKLSFIDTTYEKGTKPIYA
jgi:hypothetical protein